MTTGGWIFMSISLVCVWSGAVWCYAKVLRSPQEEKVPIGFGP